MAIITSGYVDRAIGTAQRTAVAPNTAVFNQYEQQARSVVASKALVKGYSIGTSSDNDFVKLLVLGQWYFFAYGFREGIEYPSVIGAAVDLLDKVSKPEEALPIPGMTPSTRDGISGTLFSSTATNSGRIQYFSRDKMRSW